MDIVIILLGYLLGSIPSGLIVGKIWFGIDVREHGSGNLGGTNSFRVLGKKAGLIVTIADILKGTLAAALPLLFHSDLHPLLVGAMAVVGHMYPIFAKFKGGKAVATSAGILLFYQPLMFLVLIIVFVCVLLMTRIVSLTSMIAAIVALIASIIVGDTPLIICISFLVIFVIYRHRANIKRIIDKTEPKISFSAKK